MSQVHFDASTPKLGFMVRTRYLIGNFGVNEPRFIEVNEAPPNKCMELTVLLGTPLAKRRARAAPSKPAAHAGR